MIQKLPSRYCFIIPPDLLYQIIKEGTSEQKDRAIRTLELSESLHMQRSLLAKMDGGSLFRVAGHQQKPKRYEEDAEDTGHKRCGYYSPN